MIFSIYSYIIVFLYFNLLIIGINLIAFSYFCYFLFFNIKFIKFFEFKLFFIF